MVTLQSRRPGPEPQQLPHELLVPKVAKGWRKTVDKVGKDLQMMEHLTWDTNGAGIYWDIYIYIYIITHYNQKLDDLQYPYG